MCELHRQMWPNGINASMKRKYRGYKDNIGDGTWCRTYKIRKTFWTSLVPLASNWRLQYSFRSVFVWFAEGADEHLNFIVKDPISPIARYKLCEASRVKIEHLHFRVSATVDVWFEPIPEYSFCIDCRQARALYKNSSAMGSNDTSTVADTLKWWHFTFTIRIPFNCFYPRCFIRSFIYDTHKHIEK